MIEELHIFGVYVSAALAWAIVASIVTFLLRGLLRRLPLERLLWFPGLIELALFASLWWGLTAFADLLLPRWILS